MSRFLKADLCRAVASFNLAMANDGCSKRFEVSGRNGYQAVDEYSVDSLGDRIGSGVDRNVGCGTAREVYHYCEARHYALRLDAVKGGS
jgi:hypothetical protein